MSTIDRHRDSAVVLSLALVVKIDILDFLKISGLVCLPLNFGQNSRITTSRTYRTLPLLTSHRILEVGSKLQCSRRVGKIRTN